MSTKTTNLGLVRPDLTDAADITKLNPNWTTLDNVIVSNCAKLLSSSDDLNEIKEAGFYYWEGSNRPLNAPSEANMNYMRVWNGGFSHCCQEIIAMIKGSNSTTYDNCVIRRNIWQDEIGEWEWVNPPLMFNQEYRTVERYKDKSVFVTLRTDGIVHKRTEDGLDITPITYGFTDLTAGTSELPTGQLYFVYE